MQELDVARLWVRIGSSVITNLKYMTYLRNLILVPRSSMSEDKSHITIIVRTHTITRCRDYRRSTTCVVVNAVSDEKIFVFPFTSILCFGFNMIYILLVEYRIYYILCSLDAMMASEESRDNAYIYTAQTAYRSKPAYWPKPADIFVVIPKQQRPCTNEMPVTRFPTTSRNTIRRCNDFPTRINEFKYFLFLSTVR